jgi:hypothetical protein
VGSGSSLLAGYWLVLRDAGEDREMFEASPSVEEWGILQLALRERDRVIAFDPHEIVWVVGLDVDDWQVVPLPDEPLRVRVKRLPAPAESLLISRLRDPKGGLWEVRFGEAAFGEPEVRIDALLPEQPTGPGAPPPAPPRGVRMPVRTPFDAFHVAKRIVVERGWTWGPQTL